MLSTALRDEMRIFTEILSKDAFQGDPDELQDILERIDALIDLLYMEP